MDFTEKFRAALKIPTFWAGGNSEPEAGSAAEKQKLMEAPLIEFQNFLAEKFPVFHQNTERFILSPYSTVYRISGGMEKIIDNKTGNKIGEKTKKAILFLAHYDVVPVEREKWSKDPFGAEIEDGFIYGRGSLDMKNTLISIMEAAENLFKEGWKPKNDIWFSFGGDEERTGVKGALETALWFKNKGINFEWILDEGTPLAEKQISGIDIPLALVSVEEKGYLSLKLSVSQDSGHASRPPKVQAAAVLAHALYKISKKPFPCALSYAVESFFKEASAYIPGIHGFVMRHARKFGALFFVLASGSPATESMIRTTVAMTQLKGSAADNVMPSEASAVINLRLLEPYTVEKAVEYIKKIINDNRVKISIYGLGTNPLAANPDYRKIAWPLIKSALEEAWPQIPVLPFIMVATTDSRHFKNICNFIYRFSPYKLDPKELSGIHSFDERISIENLQKGLVFYTALMRSL